MPESFSHYQILSPLGAGGMGEVYRARDTELDREVALKILPETFAADPERLARFEREAKVLASLNHPNIGAIYAIAREGDRIGLALELVEGEDLAEHIARGALPMDEALDIAGQIATALEVAHEQGIVHRDLKPANVKITPDGTVKVLDFGLAKALDSAGEMSGDPSITQSPTMMTASTQAGMILGTAAYMSPEQARGKPLDRRTDIFSFGIVLYEMLTGGRPFDGDTISDTLASILKEQPNRDALPAQTPPAVQLLIDRCLEKDAKKRIRDIGEARLIIEAVRGGDATATSVFGAVSAPDTEAPVQPSRFRPREIIAWGLAVVAVAVLGFTMMQSDDGATVSNPPAHKLSVPIEGRTALRYSHRGLAISPDGKRVAYINKNKLHIRRLDTWDPIEVPQSENCGSPFWSPDGAWLAYYTGKEMWKVRPDGTERTNICTRKDAFPPNAGGAWLADDRIVFRGAEDLMFVPARGGEPDTFLTAAGVGLVDFHEPAAMPGGRGVVSVLHSNAGTNALGVVSLDGALKKVVETPGSDYAQPCYSASGHILVTNNGDLWAIPFSLAAMEATGDPVTVARDAAVPSVSENGTLVYVRGAGKIMRQLVLVNRAGAIVEQLGQPADIWAAYALASDGTRAVAMPSGGQEDLWIHDNRQAVSRATFTDIEHDMPSVSPDGSTLYFATGVEDDYRIGRKSMDRNEPEEILVPAGELGPHYYAACPVLANDGKTLFYTANGANKKQDVAWLDLSNGSAPQRFLSGAAAEFDARPSPVDTKFVAYVSDESGENQVYLTTWPDADQKLLVSIEGGVWPRWKGDGTELYYAYDDRIYAVAISYEPLSVGRPVELLTRLERDDRQPNGWPATFGVTPDGERFLTTEIVLDESLDPRIAIVENWAQTMAE